ncbi:hypothetical protein A8926_2329 [Saccharopolyspora spinosa]|uniref:Uncharacterized protein n=1 Tax=Saccharopolyspora spinosa TaxID=60894 RepID=A0A2N3XVI5_SACSN|nr:hypothetical protein A8926_2329 [Saccharopolyspora spinosa]
MPCGRFIENRPPLTRTCKITHSSNMGAQKTHGPVRGRLAQGGWRHRPRHRGYDAGHHHHLGVQPDAAGPAADRPAARHLQGRLGGAGSPSCSPFSSAAGAVQETLEEIAAGAIDFYTGTFPNTASLFSGPPMLTAHRDTLQQRGMAPRGPRQAGGLPGRRTTAGAISGSEPRSGGCATRSMPPERLRRPLLQTSEPPRQTWPRRTAPTTIRTRTSTT